MKKLFAGMVVSIMLVGLMGTTVFAAGSPNAKNLTEQAKEAAAKVTIASDDIKAYNKTTSTAINITTEAVDPVAWDRGQDAIKAKFGASNAEIIAAAELKSENITGTASVTIKLGKGVRTTDNIHVLHYENDAWTDMNSVSGANVSVTADSSGNAYVTLNMTSFSPVMVVYVKSTSASTTTTPNATDSTQNSTQNSTQDSTQNSTQDSVQNSTQDNSGSDIDSSDVPSSGTDSANDYTQGYNDGYEAGVNSVSQTNSGSSSDKSTNSNSTKSKSTKSSSTKSSVAKSSVAKSSTAKSSTKKSSSTKSSGSASNTVYRTANTTYSVNTSTTSPKTGASLPAMPFVALFAFAGLLVCGKKGQDQ